MLTKTSTIEKLLEKAGKFEASTIEVTRLTAEGRPYRIDRKVHQAKMIYEVRDGFFVLSWPAENDRNLKTYLPLSHDWLSPHISILSHPNSRPYHTILQLQTRSSQPETGDTQR